MPRAGRSAVVGSYCSRPVGAVTDSCPQGTQLMGESRSPWDRGDGKGWGEDGELNLERTAGIPQVDKEEMDRNLIFHCNPYI